VEATLLESALGYAVWETGLYVTTGEVAVPRGSRHRLAAPYEALKTGDGYIVVGANNQRLWERLCEALDARRLQDDPRFAAPRDRLGNRDALQVELEAILATQPAAHWLERLLAAGVPCGPINTIAQAVEDPHVQTRGLIAEVNGRRFTRAPVTLPETPVAVALGPAAVGEHTREVLQQAGYDDGEIQALEATGAIQLAAGA
jgi:formyl-CoA transferase